MLRHVCLSIRVSWKNTQCTECTCTVYIIYTCPGQMVTWFNFNTSDQHNTHSTAWRNDVDHRDPITSEQLLHCVGTQVCFRLLTGVTLTRGALAAALLLCPMSRKRPADALEDPPPIAKNSKHDGPSEMVYTTVKFKQSTAQVRPVADGRLFADPPFHIAPAAFDISKGLKPSSKQTIKKGDLDMIYFRPFLVSSTATSLYSWCLAELPWFKVQYKARGMDINTPRLPQLSLYCTSFRYCC